MRVKKGKKEKPLRLSFWVLAQREMTTEKGGGCESLAPGFVGDSANTMRGN